MKATNTTNTASAAPKADTARHYTVSDTVPHAGKRGLFVDESTLVSAPLWWQKQGLNQTASGYGQKLTTTRKIHFEGKLRRIYCTCYSNVGSCWFLFRGETIYVN